MAKCGDCLYFGMCSHYVDAEETFPEIEGGCYVFDKKADYVKVVRCKDCKYWEKGKDYEPYCNHWGGMMTDTDADDFCSYGERKDNERKAD